MNILYAILHGQGCADRYENITETWGKNKNLIFYSDHEDLSKNTYKLSNNTSYQSAEEKHLNSLSFIANNFGSYDWIFFCDDDTFVNTEYLENEEFDENYIYGLVITGQWPFDKELPFCSGGAGYLISKKNLIKLVENIYFPGTGTSDVSLGYIAKKANISFINDDRFKSQKPHFYNMDKNDVKKYFTFHYLKTKQEQLELLNLV